MTGEKKDAAFAFAHHVVSVKYEDIPEEAIQASKADILDALGVALASSTTTPACREMAELVKEFGGKEESSIIAYGGKVPCYMAAFVNAALVHSLNYNDLFDAYWVHPGSVLLPSALAIAERVENVSGREFIVAYTIGLDIMGRLGRAIFPPVPLREWAVYSWLPPQIFGYFGAAGIAGRLLGLDENQMVSAFGLAYCQTAGNMEPLFGLGADKGIYPAYPAQAGLLSALMAQKNILGPSNSLEGEAGLFNVYFQGDYDSDSLTTDLGKDFKGVELGLYAFPCCGWSQIYITTALQMIDEHKIVPQDVESVTIYAGPRAKHLCEPLEVRRNPRNLTEAQMSIPFILAIIIVKGKPRIEHFTGEGLGDSEVLRLSNKVSWQPDPTCDRRYGTGVSKAKIEMTLKGGKVIGAEQEGFRYGHPQNPIEKEDLLEKFRDCASFSAKPISKESVEKIIDIVEHLEELPDVSQIMELVT
ncbi:MmgE/PrpD family protein [Chloroflexota bacterium]